VLYRIYLKATEIPIRIQSADFLNDRILEILKNIESLSWLKIEKQKRLEIIFLKHNAKLSGVSGWRGFLRMQKS
jgi:hypothetical protein